MKTMGTRGRRVAGVALVTASAVIVGAMLFVGGKLREAYALLSREKAGLEARLLAAKSMNAPAVGGATKAGKDEGDISTPKKRREAAVREEIEALKAELDSGRRPRLPKKTITVGQAMYPQLLRIPEYATLYRVVERGAVERQYAEFFAKARLPDETRDRVLALLVEKRVVEFGGDPEPWLTGMNFGLELPSHSKKTLATWAIGGEVKALLKGEARGLYERLGSWVPDQGIATPLSALRTRLSFAGEPLTAEQFERLRDRSLEVVPGFEGTSAGPVGIDGIRMTRGGWPDTLKEAAQGMLTPSQFQVLLQLQEESVAREEKDRRMHQAYGDDE